MMSYLQEQLKTPKGTLLAYGRGFGRQLLCNRLRVRDGGANQEMSFAPLSLGGGLCLTAPCAARACSELGQARRHGALEARVPRGHPQSVRET
jgi:hypothetical protein